jgi:hypothetical protein
MCNVTHYKLDVTLTGLALCRPGFNPKWAHMGFVVDKIALEQV